MNILRLTVLAWLLQAVVSPVYADDVRPGLWSITLSMTAAGMDSELGPYTSTQCFTQADAKNPGKLFAEMGGGCTYGDKHYQGNRFTFTVQCSGAIPMQGEGEVSYGETSFEGNLAIQAKVADMGQVKTKSRVKGNRLGDCKAEIAQ
jgi:hypothetical protein